MSGERGVQMDKAAEMLQSLIKPVINGLTIVTPHIILYGQKFNAYYKKLPTDHVKILVGFIFCFFGGMYPTVFAAIQAAKHGGYSTLKTAMKDLIDEVQIIIEASKKDDEKDEDKDGKKDVDEIDSKRLLARKINLVMQKCNPNKIDKALGSLFTVWTSIIATLKIQFARTIALALTISEALKSPLDRIVLPTVQRAIPPEYQQWAPIVLSWAVKSIAMSIAWYIQIIISAFTSAVEGGMLMSRTLLKICREKNINLGGLIKEDDATSHTDEMVGYALAALGFYFQFRAGFDVPFPLNLVLWPFEMAEYYIRWTITD